MLQASFDSEYSEFYEKYYFMKFYKGLDSSKLFESLAKGEFSGEKNSIYLFKTVSAKTCNIFPILDLRR